MFVSYGRLFSCIAHFRVQSWENYVCRSLRCSMWNAESLRASNIAQVHTRSYFPWRMKDPVPDLQRFLSEVSEIQLVYKNYNSWPFVHSRTLAGELLLFFVCVCILAKFVLYCPGVMLVWSNNHLRNWYSDTDSHNQQCVTVSGETCK